MALHLMLMVVWLNLRINMLRDGLFHPFFFGANDINEYKTFPIMQ